VGEGSDSRTPGTDPGASTPRNPAPDGSGGGLLPPAGAHLVLSVIVALGVGAGAIWSESRPTPDVGALAALYAPPAETTETVRLSWGETLGDVLYSRTAMDDNEVDALLRAFRVEASPRRIRSGTSVVLLRRTGQQRVRAVEVELNPDERVRVARDGDGWSARKVQTPVRTDTLFIAGTIENVLWSSILEHPELAEMPAADRAIVLHRLDQIFQWQIDFSRQIREGDTFRFVLEREVRPDGSMRSGRVLAAQLRNQEIPYHAIRFDPNGDGRGTYYDLEGRSVRRAFLKKPLEFRRISSRFTSGRYHPVLRRWRAHRGVDYAADRGTPIMATGDGVVIHRGPKGGLGNAVVIRHPNGFRTRYGHMSYFARGVAVGTRVRQGQVIGYVGATGLATGPHLHYEMMRSGRHVDPLGIELPPGDPVPEDRRGDWERTLVRNRALLSRTPAAISARVAMGGQSPVGETGEEGE